MSANGAWLAKCTWSSGGSTTKAFMPRVCALSLVVTNKKAVFGGDNGHRDEVLSVSVHDLGNCILSAGMDHSIKVWALDNEDVTEAIKHKNDAEPRRTVFQEGPVFSTYRVHSVSEMFFMFRGRRN